MGFETVSVRIGLVWVCVPFMEPVRGNTEKGREMIVWSDNLDTS